MLPSIQPLFTFPYFLSCLLCFHPSVLYSLPISLTLRFPPHQHPSLLCCLHSFLVPIFHPPRFCPHRLSLPLFPALSSLHLLLLQEMTGWSRLLLIQSVLPGVCISRVTGQVSRRMQTLSALTHRGREADTGKDGERKNGRVERGKERREGLAPAEGKETRR